MIAAMSASIATCGLTLPAIRSRAVAMWSIAATEWPGLVAVAYWVSCGVRCALTSSWSVPSWIVKTSRKNVVRSISARSIESVVPRRPRRLAASARRLNSDRNCRGIDSSGERPNVSRSAVDVSVEFKFENNACAAKRTA